MSCLILTEAGKNIGLGHLTRCISLAQAFSKKGIETILVLDAHEDLDFSLTDHEIEIRYHAWQNDKNYLKEVLNKIDFAIIDSYICTSNTYQFIAEEVKYSLWVDDENRLSYPAGFVLNGGIGASFLSYPQTVDITYLLGLSFQPMRKEFWSIPPVTIREEVRDILIFLGGTDARNLNYSITEMIRKTLPDIRLHIISETRNIYIDKTTNTYQGLSATELIRLFNKVDLVITAGGQTLNELARVGLPPIVIEVASNQRNNINGWRKTDFIKYIGKWNKINENSIHNAILDSLPQKARQKMHVAGLMAVDGMGAFRVIDMMLNKSKLSQPN